MSVILILSIIVLIGIVFIALSRGRKYNFLKEFENTFHNIKSIASSDLQRATNDILAVLDPQDYSNTDPDSNSLWNEKEDFEFFHPANYRYWPQYHYSFPYTLKNQDPWPPGLFSRLYQWEPGFSSGSGWSYYLRPGVHYDKIQRSRWVKHGGKYYYINNGDSYDRENDYYPMH